MEPEYAAFVRSVDAGDATALDPYGAQGLDEFFAVAAEMFFVNPAAMRAAHPQLYAMFAEYFRQDPAQESAGSSP
jgi:Mlc titration factor MtfA (ptsG expression regulator)